MLEILILVVILALVYDFGNGMNDAANSISTIVATKVLSPGRAVLIAALGNFVGPFLLGTAVATTIGKGIVSAAAIDSSIITTALIGAIFWTYLQTSKGFPISVTHSLIGGLLGAGIVKVGLSGIMISKVIIVLLFIFVAPMLGLIGGILFSGLIFRLFRKSSPSRVNIYFKRLQLISSTLYSIGHGANDAQNAMGIIAITLFTTGLLGSTFYVPSWVIIICAAAISLGTLMGGWKVVRTMGMRITKLQPVDGFNAETSGGLTLFCCTLLGIPVSTTHVLAGSITGSGVIKRLSAVRWWMVKNIVWAWVLTIPASALVGICIYLLLSVVI
ncbi:MAG: inorganic phosphate transporter [Candidatus Aenigmarchaeota archaeon]|nr:inorganic phosphate transporter [Candidatus Aenigmarchaeota archaeon]